MCASLLASSSVLFPNTSQFAPNPYAPLPLPAPPCPLQEQSSVGWRMFMSLVGCLNLRGFIMPFIPAGAPPGTELFHLDRKYHCGGCLCDPLQASWGAILSF